MDLGLDTNKWKEVLDIGGTVAALAFAGLAFATDVRVRRAQTAIEITKQHRELWRSFYDSPHLARLFDADRDLGCQPLADEEVHFVNLLLQHLRSTFIAKQAGIYAQPEHLEDDVRVFFSYPSTKAVWLKQKHFHDKRFVKFIEKQLSPKV